MGRVPRSFPQTGAHLHNDIHDLLVFPLGFPKGPDVEGADPEGEGAVDGEEEKQGGQRLRHPGAAPGSGLGRGQQCPENSSA